MALKTITSYKTDIITNNNNRLDAKYFYINHVFSKLKNYNSYKIKTLGDLKAKISSGSYINKYISKTQGVPYIRVGNIKPFSISEDDVNLVYVSNDLPKKIKVEKNSIILGRTQATTAKLAVASIVSQENEGYVISQHISKIVLEDDTLTPYFLVAYLNSNFYKLQTALATHGDTRVELTHSQLRNIRIFIPRQDIIKSISDKVKLIIKYNFLSLENIREAKNTLSDLLGINSLNLKKVKAYSINYSLLEKNNFWNPLFYYPPYLNIFKEIKKNINTIPLGEIVNIKKGTEVGSDNYVIGLEKKEGYIPFIRTSDLINYEADQFPDYYISNDIYQKLNQDIRPGDILFTKDGKIGMTAMLTQEDKAIIASGIVRVRLKPEASHYNVTPEYLFTVLSLKEIGFNQALRRTVIASTIPHLREQRLKEIEIPIPNKNIIDNITILVKKAFDLKTQRKRLIEEVIQNIDSYFDT